MHIPLHTHSKQEHEGVEPISTLRVVAEIFRLGGKRSRHAKNKVSNLCLKNVDFLGATPKVYLLVFITAPFGQKYLQYIQITSTFQLRLYISVFEWFHLF